MWIGAFLLLITYFQVSSSHDTQKRYKYVPYIDKCSSFIPKGFEPQLCIQVYRNGIRTKLIVKSTEYKSFTYYKGDNIKLTCERKWPDIPRYKDHPTLRWTVSQRNHVLLVTTEKQMDNEIGVYSTNIVLDYYDHNLIAKCEAFSQRRNKSLEIQFITGGEMGHEGVPKNQTREYKEDESVPNNLNRTVLVYNNTDWKETGVIDPASNIFDSLTTENNGSIYTAWFQERPLENPTLKKQKWKIIVLPHDKNNIGSGLPTSSIAVVASIACSLAVISVVIIIFVYIKYYKGRETQNDIYEHIYTDATHVVYAQVDLKDSNGSVPNRANEPYAQIIGVLKPKKKRITKTNQPETKY